MVGRP